MKSLRYILAAIGFTTSSLAFAQGQQAIDEAKAAVASDDYSPIAAELLAILDEDQRCRLQLPEVEKQYGRDSEQMKDLWKVIEETDASNLIKVKAILDSHGWLGPKQVGAKGNSALFLVIQHSNLATQQKYLPMMRSAVKDGHARASSLALLEDRVALAEGRPQIYGSQIMRDQTHGGKYYVRPILDPGKVDERRASVGLGPLSDYVKNWDIIWDVEAHKKELPDLIAQLRPLKQ